MQNVHSGICCMARSAVLLEPHVYIHIVQFGPKEIGYHPSVALTIDGDSLTNFILKKYGPMMPPAQNLHQTVSFCGCIVTL